MEKICEVKAPYNFHSFGSVLHFILKKNTIASLWAWSAAQLPNCVSSGSSHFKQVRALEEENNSAAPQAQRCGVGSAVVRSVGDSASPQVWELP